LRPRNALRIGYDDYISDQAFNDFCCVFHAVNVPLVVSTCLVNPPLVVVVIVPV